MLKWLELLLKNQFAKMPVNDAGEPDQVFANLMVYAANNPVRFIDPTGLEPSECDRVAAFGDHITKKMFRQACEDAGWPAALCQAMAKRLQGTTCNTIAEWCEHLKRHGGDGLGRKATEACLGAYLQLCSGQ